MQIIYTWLPLLAIALVSIWLRNPPFTAPKEEDADFDPAHFPSTRRKTAFAAFKDQVPLFAKWQTH